MQNKVLAIILNYNSCDDTIKCANLLEHQSNLDICIVDNASTEDVKRLEEFTISKEYLFSKNFDNKGYSNGNNKGMKKAVELGYKYALIINPDVEIRDENYVLKAIEKLDSNENIAVLATDVVLPNGNHQNPMKELKYYQDLLWPAILIRNKICKSMPFVGDYKKSGYCEKVSGCCFFIRMSFVEDIGYFDDTRFLYSEEAILGAQVKKADKKMYYMHSLTAGHMHVPSKKGDPVKRIEDFLGSRIYYLQTYAGYGRFRTKLVVKSINLQEKFLKKKKMKEKKENKDG